MPFSSYYAQHLHHQKKRRLWRREWSNHAQFWEQRYNSRKDHIQHHQHEYQEPAAADGGGMGGKEVILVGIGREEDAFQLLSWAISIAARPGDMILAFYLTNDVRPKNILSVLRSQTSRIHRDDAVSPPPSLTALKGLCELKEVKLDARFSRCNGDGNEDSEIVKMAKSLSATMLVVSPSARHMIWNAQRRGKSLARKLPPGCSVVVVKDSKMLFYKENASDALQGARCGYAEGGSLLIQPKEKVSVQYRRSLSSQFSCTSSPLWSREEDEEEEEEDEDDDDNDENEDEDEDGDGDRTGVAEEYLDLNPRSHSGSRVWPVPPREGGSPRGVLDSLLLPSDSDISLTSRSITHCNSRKSLLSCVSSVEEEEEEEEEEDDGDDDCRDGYGTMSRFKAKSLPSLWRNGSICRESAMPFPLRLKKSRSSLDRTSIRGSLKLYVSALLGAAEMTSHSPTSVASADPLQQQRCFSHGELAFATDNFSQGNMVGRGGHAEVYRGTLVDGRIIAVKRLTKVSLQEAAKEKDFLTELGIVAHVCHPNTTPLVGFCIEGGLHLVFEFSSHGSLAGMLHGANMPPLDWCARYRIAVGTARGIDYLHTGGPRRIIHRDIKASNILLGAGFEPQISDFGLAKWLPSQSSQLSVSPVEGTFGYLAPEYFMYGIVHEKTDVFAYGVLLLELISGRQPINHAQQSLVVWAKPMLESSKIEDLVDPKLEGKYDQKEMQCIAMVANLCIQPSPICRPNMSQVLEVLTNEQVEVHHIPSEASFYEGDLGEEYNSSKYHSDLCRHREIALQF